MSTTARLPAAPGLRRSADNRSLHRKNTAPGFWRNPAMPYVELRQVPDGRRVCYALHSHTQWSLGAVTAGQSTFLYRHRRYPVQAGSLVLVNPDWPHACNPVEDQPWAYRMLYVDTAWLTRLRYGAGLLPQPRWQDIGTAVVTDPELYQGYCAMTDCLLDADRDLLEKQSHLVEYLSTLLQRVSRQPARPEPSAPDTLRQVAAWLDAHCTEEVSLDDLCRLSGYSPGHLIRAFRQHYAITPHAYLVNRRIQFAQKVLKDGASIVEAALAAGFADQAHFQRVFKRLLAATPGQYRQS